MTESFTRDRPLIFLSFAGNDRRRAEELRNHLDALGFDAFVDEHCIEPGENLLIAINKALTRSSFCVLLWSRHAQNRPWVEVEWTAALSRDLDEPSGDDALSRGVTEKRSFLFIVRLDETELPLLLATRRYLDASSDGQLDKAAAELVRTWRRDRELDTPVLPAPNPIAMDRSGNGGLIELYVRNRALSVSHVLTVPSTADGSELFDRVHKALDLRDSESKFNGIVSLRVAYELKYRDKELLDEPLTDLGIRDGDTIDLVMHGEFVSHGQPVSTWTFRDNPASRQSAISPQIARALIDAAFGHLRP
jgi:hypothetical protein